MIGNQIYFIFKRSVTRCYCNKNGLFFLLFFFVIAFMMREIVHPKLISEAYRQIPREIILFGKERKIPQNCYQIISENYFYIMYMCMSSLVLYCIISCLLFYNIMCSLTYQSMISSFEFVIKPEKSDSLSFVLLVPENAKRTCHRGKPKGQKVLSHCFQGQHRTGGAHPCHLVVILAFIGHRLFEIPVYSWVNRYIRAIYLAQNQTRTISMPDPSFHE